jgi:superfamily II DNA or RNA helicase
VLRKFTEAYFRMGISATTSGRGDRRDAYVVGHFGKVVHEIPVQQVAEQGNIARAHITFLRCDQPGTKKYQAGGYEQAIVRSQVRNGMIIGLLKQIELPALIYVIQLDHVRYLGKLCEDAGLSHVEIVGPTTTKARKERVGLMEKRAVDVVVATNAARQGLDLIHIRTVILAGGNREEIGTIQRQGRGVRVCFPGQRGECETCKKYGLKSSMALYDFYDLDSWHNAKIEREGDKLTSSNRHWLEQHALRRIAAFKKKQYEVQVR